MNNVEAAGWTNIIFKHRATCFCKCLYDTLEITWQIATRIMMFHFGPQSCQNQVYCSAAPRENAVSDIFLFTLFSNDLSYEIVSFAKNSG